MNMPVTAGKLGCLGL